MNKSEIKSIIRRLCRNTRALWLRVVLGIRHGDTEETLRAIVRMTNEGIWLLCWVAFVFSFLCGFFKPMWFLGSLGFVVLAALWRSINIDEQLCR